MATQLLFFGLIVLLGVSMPGPDFVMVMTNTLLHSRHAGLWTALGIASASLIHASYSMFGLALVINQSIIFLHLIRMAGSSYIIYLGIRLWLSKNQKISFISENNSVSNHSELEYKYMSSMAAFRQGFMCNLFNPKPAVFYLALFTSIIDANMNSVYHVLFLIEVFIIGLTWLVAVVMLISHPYVMKFFVKVERHIPRILGTCLICFGTLFMFC